MSRPTSKATFKEHCLRRLGKPVIEINVDEDQLDDRVDEALDYYADHLDYAYKYKSVYLLIIVGFVASVYLISCYLTGVLKIRNFRTN